MESRFCHIFLKFNLKNVIRTLWLVPLLVVNTSVFYTHASAQETLDLEIESIVKTEKKPMEFNESKIDTEDFEAGVYFGLLSVEDFGVNSVIGARLAYHINEDLFLEASYGISTTQKTSFERLSGATQLLTEEERELTYYNVSLGYNILPGEAFISRKAAFNTALYIIGGAGSTRFAGDDRFTINFGAGYRFLATDWIAIHLDVRDHMFEIDILGEKKSTHNIEISGGLALFF
ncbi:FIG01036464: hypothetical protein [hydrothermal vent metagenome]|uniref:Outer membrane beta-barrel domain-containing protein n=1 Tax=hydrothermal vent metagenome TaxID=652676 RepID=A0A3B0ZBN3_9ZZZZ